jgi:hypothetical protein
MDFKSNPWALVGKLLSGLVVVVTLVGGVLAIYDRNSDKPDLEAIVSDREFRDVPVVDEKSPADPNWRFESAAIGRRFVVVNLVNRGGARADDISLSYPSAGGVAEIYSPIRPPVRVKFVGSVSLGALAPSDVITVRIWTDGQTQTIPNSIGIVHSAGTADIEFTRERTGSLRETLNSGVFGLAIGAFASAITSLLSLIWLRRLRVRIDKRLRSERQERASRL